MITRTNYQMLVELDKEYTPEQRGIVSMNEIYLINEKLCLDDMDVIQLRNMRDFAVMWYGQKFDETNEMIHMDKMSAIVSVIDNKIFNKGGEV